MMSSEGKVIHASDADGVSLRGTRIAYLVTAENSNHFSLFEFLVDPGCGSGVHSHTTFEEAFYVLEGELRFQMGDETVSAGPGTVLHVPAGRRHGFTNEGSQPARMLMMTMPSGYEQYFSKLAHVVNQEGPLDTEAVAALRRQYDTVQLTAPQVQ